MTNRQKFTEVFDCEIVRRDTGEPVPGHCKILIAESEHFDEWLQKEYEPSAQPGWIPCGERLPYAEYGESDTVLTTCGYRDVEDTSVRWIRLLYFNGGNWCYPTGETYEAKVYAWQPLPTPWEGGQDESSD